MRTSGMSILKSMIKTKILLLLLIPLLVIGCNKKSIDGNNRENYTENTQDSCENEKIGTDQESSIDWLYYEDKFNDEEKIIFSKYLPVLNNEELFFCYEWTDERINITEYLDSICAKEQPEIAGMALVDIDNQNEKELIIHFYEGGGNYLILTIDNGEFYGTNMGERWFETLQNDGKYISAGSSSDWYFYTMKLDHNGCETNCFGELHGEKIADGIVEEKLVINGKSIDNPQEWISDNYSDDVNWIE